MVSVYSVSAVIVQRSLVVRVFRHWCVKHSTTYGGIHPVRRMLFARRDVQKWGKKEELIGKHFDLKKLEVCPFDHLELMPDEATLYGGRQERRYALYRFPDHQHYHGESEHLVVSSSD